MTYEFIFHWTKRAEYNNSFSPTKVLVVRDANLHHEDGSIAILIFFWKYRHGLWQRIGAKLFWFDDQTLESWWRSSEIKKMYIEETADNNE